uniref:Uncharacterized protein n=1 Tax=Romanomermis culicivorax TaxID=13658 RepID=A0A915JT95_ROMCU
MLIQDSNPGLCDYSAAFFYLNYRASVAIVTKIPKVAHQHCTKGFPWINDTLPSSIQPFLYGLHLQPNLMTGEFTGAVDIYVRIQQKTDWLILNAKLPTGIENDLVVTLKFSGRMNGDEIHKLFFANFYDEDDNKVKL